MSPSPKLFMYYTSTTYIDLHFQIKSWQIFDEELVAIIVFVYMFYSDPDRPGRVQFKFLNLNPHFIYNSNFNNNKQCNPLMRWTMCIILMTWRRGDGA